MRFVEAKARQGTIRLGDRKTRKDPESPRIKLIISKLGKTRKTYGGSKLRPGENPETKPGKDPEGKTRKLPVSHSPGKFTNDTEKSRKPLTSHNSGPRPSPEVLVIRLEPQKREKTRKYEFFKKNKTRGQQKHKNLHNSGPRPSPEVIVVWIEWKSCQDSVKKGPGAPGGIQKIKSF